MRNLIVLGAGALAAWYGGDSVGRWLVNQLGGPSDYMRMIGWFLAFFGGAIVGQTLLSFRRQSGGGVSPGGWAIVMRPVTGSIAKLFVQAVVMIAFLLGVIAVINQQPPFPSEEARGRWIFGAVAATFAFYALAFGLNGERTGVYRLIGVATAPLRTMLRITKFGKGGSGAFAGLLTDWENLWRPGAILLGRSAYGKEWRIGLKDDRHLMTIASPRGGKGRSAIIPNLLTWPGSALVIDPKGTNAAVTSARRGHGRGRVAGGLGQAVHVFDPFKVLSPLGIETSRFNPLALLDPNSERIVEDIWYIADALVVPDPKAPHWDGSAHSLISGVIAHVITSPFGEEKTLGRVRALLTDPFFVGSDKQMASGESIIGEMLRNDGAAGLASRSAGQIVSAGDQERGSIISTALRHTKWLDSPPMQSVLAGDGFDLRDLKRTRMTVYVVIPPEELETHKRFLRLFVTLGIHAVYRETTRPKDKVLFIIDEFAGLGRIDALRSNLNMIGSYGVIVWPIIQNLNQLIYHYRDDYQSFLDATAAVQVFSMGGQATAEYVAQELGERLIDRKVRGQVVTALARLQTAGEAREQTARDRSMQIVLRGDKPAMLLRRLMYDKEFRRDEYSPDPDHPDPASASWYRGWKGSARPARTEVTR